MAARAQRSRWRSVPTAVAEFVDRRGWSPVALLNAVDRLYPGRGRARKAADGIAYGPHGRHQLDIWVPAGRRKAGERLPVVVFFYGGGWHAGSRTDYGFAGAAFATEGFVAVVPDYRLAPLTRYPGFMWDGAMALRWIWRNIANYGGDPASITVSGHSAGAYIAAMLALDTRWLSGVQLPRNAIKAAALLSGPYDFFPFREYRGRATFGFWPNPAETQPVSWVRPDAPPMLLMHGSTDRLVYAKNSRHLAERLASVGAPVTLKIYPGANHADPVVSLSRPFRTRLPVLADAAAFLRSATTLPTSRSTK